MPTFSRAARRFRAELYACFTRLGDALFELGDDQTAAGQIRALVGRLDAGGRMPLFVFDGGYDSAQLTLDLPGACGGGGAGAAAL